MIIHQRNSILTINVSLRITSNILLATRRMCVTRGTIRPRRVLIFRMTTNTPLVRFNNRNIIANCRVKDRIRFNLRITTLTRTCVDAIRVRLRTKTSALRRSINVPNYPSYIRNRCPTMSATKIFVQCVKQIGKMKMISIGMPKNIVTIRLPTNKREGHNPINGHIWVNKSIRVPLMVTRVPLTIRRFMMDTLLTITNRDLFRTLMKSMMNSLERTIITTLIRSFMYARGLVLSRPDLL